jgi:hypothetical protein
LNAAGKIINPDKVSKESELDECLRKQCEAEYAGYNAYAIDTTWNPQSTSTSKASRPSAAG